MNGPLQKPVEDMSEAAATMVRAWQAFAAASADIAHARRTIFLAYVAEGFTEPQALELVRSL